MNPKPSRRARILATAVSLIALGVSFGLCELGVRILRPGWKPPPPEGVPFFRPDPRLGWRLREGWSGAFPLPHRTTHVAISSQGLRDDEYAPTPAAGRKRLLLLGDSFAWGFGVEKGESFDTLLEAMFPDLEVVNAAVPGYGTDQELIYLEEAGFAFHPNAVVVLFHPNDLLNNTWPRQYGYPKPVFELEGSTLVASNLPVPMGPIRSLGMRLLRRSYLAHELWRVTVEPTQDLHQSPRLAWDVTEQLLVRMRDDATRNGASFTVITFPWVDEATNRLLERVRTLIARNGLDHIDLTSAFPDGLAPHLDGATEHWSPEGHQLVARALAQQLPGLIDADKFPARRERTTGR